MVRDLNRAELPPGACWNLVDFIPDQLGAPLRGRGGWAYVGGSMTSVSSIKALVYAPFVAGAKVLGIGQNGELWDVLTPTDIGAAIVPGSPPTYYRSKVLIPNNDGTTAPKYYDGTTLGNLAGTPPNGKLVGSFKDHAILACDSSNPQRLWFSAAGDPTTWDTSNGYVDANGGPITAIATLSSMILVFHPATTDRIRGSIPPPGTDFVQDTQFLNVGCLDPFSVAMWNNRVIFANATGIFMTDGAGWNDLTAKAGMSTWWQTQMASYASTWRLAAGVYRSHYILAINNGTSLVDCLVCNLNTGAIWRFSNIHANALCQVQSGGAEECYIGLSNGGRVGKLSTAWSPASAVKKDGDATVMTPTFETVAHQGFDRLHRKWIASYGQQRWKWLYYSMQLTDYAADAPTVNLSYLTTPNASSYTSVGAIVAATSKLTEGRRAIGTGNKSPWLAMKVALTGPGDLQLFELGLAYDPLEVGALPQS